MPLVKQTLSAQLKLLYDQLSQQTENPDQARQKLADDLATAIDAYIKTSTVTVTVATAGTATAQTGTGTGTLS